MIFDHPEQAMRARLTDQLACEHCAHITFHGWCARHTNYASSGGPVHDTANYLTHGYCPQFEHVPFAWRTCVDEDDGQEPPT